MTAPTAQQQAAIETHDRALLVEAGAGTGKTWVLVQRFLRLLETRPDWPIESIVAVTFTEKAAREMRSRIRQGVETRAALAPADSPWHERRRALDRLQVGTIHSLCARLLRENAIAAALDPHFTVLDETEAGLLREQAIRRALQTLARDDHPALSLLAELTVRDLRDEMADLLARRATVGRLFDELPAPAALLSRWREGVAAMREALWQHQLATVAGLAEALATLPRWAIPTTDDKLVPALQLAHQGCQALDRGDLVAAAALWDGIGLQGGSKNSWGTVERVKELKELLKRVREAARAFQKQGGGAEVGEADERAATALHQWRAVWQTLEEAYQTLKAERQALDFDDLELFAARLLAQEPRSARLQAWLDAIQQVMVDEFQDTNGTQQRIVYALAHPSGGRLFVVGDAKQSIYRFRQAQVSVFHETGAHIEAANGARQPLNQSFRAHAGLIGALNHAFDQVLQPLGAAREPWEAASGPLAPSRAAPAPHPLAPAPVELCFVPDEADGSSLKAPDARRHEARLLAARLHALREGKAPVWDRAAGAYRPFRYSDAAILFRATTDLPVYEEQFKAAGLPFLTVSGRGFFDRPEVQDLVSLLACLHNPADDLHLAATLRSPLFSLSDETLYRLRWHVGDWRLEIGDWKTVNLQSPISNQPLPLRNALSHPPPTDQPDEVARAAATLETLWGLAGRVTVWHLLRRALDETAYEATLALGEPALGGRQRANVAKFLELARTRGGASLSAFLRQVQDLKSREAREGEALASAPETGAVQLMSIHAAKGLEFPVVAVADLGRGAGGGDRSPRVMADPTFGLVCKQRDEGGAWYKPAGFRWAEWLHGRMEQAESKRLLYVACTRAADLLILSGKSNGGKGWLGELCKAWAVDEAGDEDEVVPRPAFALRVRRPRAAPAAPRPAAPPAPDAEALAPTMPALAEPLPASRWASALPLAQLARALNNDEAGPAPSVPPLNGTAHPDALPSATLAALLRRLLADDGWLTLPDDALVARLATWAQHEGAPPTLAASRVLALLSAFRRAPLFAQIQRARQRHHALPFALETPAGLLHGQLDLLWQNEAGHWHLARWETAWAQGAKATERAAQAHLLLAVQARAVAEAIGAEPEAWWIPWQPQVAVHPVPQATLDAAWDTLTHPASP